MSSIELNMLFSATENAVFSATENWVASLPASLRLDLRKTYSFYCEKIELAGVGGFSDSSVGLTPLISDRTMIFSRETIESPEILIEPVYQELSGGGYYRYAHRVTIRFVWRQAGRPFGFEHLLASRLPQRCDVRMWFRGGSYFDVLQSSFLYRYDGFQPRLTFEFRSVYVIDEASGTPRYVNPSTAEFLRGHPSEMSDSERFLLELVGQKEVGYEHWRPSSRYVIDSEGRHWSRETGRRQVARVVVSGLLDSKSQETMRIRKDFLRWAYGDDAKRWIRFWDYWGSSSTLGYVNVSLRDIRIRSEETFMKSAELEIVERVPDLRLGEQAFA